MALLKINPAISETAAVQAAKQAQADAEGHPRAEPGAHSSRSSRT